MNAASPDNEVHVVTETEHRNRIATGDMSPRVLYITIDQDGEVLAWTYMAWTPTKIGAGRKGPEAAITDLREICAEYAATQKYTEGETP